ncbi:hypothetical protein K2X33_06660 [bacterium]|nr:hypothetical protein [bacterium]
MKYLCILLTGFSAWAAPLKPPIAINVDAVPISLNPATVTDTIGAWVLFHVADRLLETQRSGLVTGNLAESWKISNQGKTLVFHLRSGVRFSDGTELNASHVVDVLHSLKKNISKGYLSFYTSNLKAAKVLAPLDVQIELERPIPGFLNILGEAAFSISKPCGTSLCFTGRFQVKRSAPSELELVRASDGQAFVLKQLAFQDAEKEFQQGRLQILRSYSLPQVARVNRAAKHLFVMKDERSYFVALNTQRAEMAESSKRKRVAETLASHGVTTRKILEDWEKGSASASLLSPSFSMGRASLTEGAAKAADLTPSQAVTKPLKIVTLKEQELAPLAGVLFEGLPYSLRYLSKPEFIDHIKSGDYDAIFFGYGTTVRDLDAVSILFHSKSMHNFARVRNAEIDGMLEAAWSEESAAKKMELISGIVGLNAQQNWYLPVAHSSLVFAISEKLQLESGRGTADHILTSSNLDLASVSWRAP